MSNNFETMNTGKLENQGESSNLETEVETLEPGTGADSALDKQVAESAQTREIDLEKTRDGIQEIGGQEKAEKERKERELTELAFAKLKEMEQMVMNRTAEKRGFFGKLITSVKEFEKNKNTARMAIRKHMKRLLERQQEGKKMNTDLFSVLEEVRTYGFDLLKEEKIDISGFPERANKKYSAGASAHTRVLGG